MQLPPERCISSVLFGGDQHAPSAARFPSLFMDRHAIAHAVAASSRGKETKAPST
jgi:hypothetical protein